MISMSEVLCLYLKNLRKKFFCSKTKLKRKEELYIEGRVMLEKELDIIHVVKKLRRFEALTKVLMTEHENYFFPYININLLGRSAKEKRKNEEPQKTTLVHLNSLVSSKNFLADRIVGLLKPGVGDRSNTEGKQEEESKEFSDMQGEIESARELESTDKPIKRN